MSKKPTIQLCLPISGRHEEARKKAAEMAKKLRKAGYRVYNPFELCAEFEKEQERTPFPPDEHWWRCVKVCCDNIVNQNVDVLLVLGNRLPSHGMLIEIITAEHLKSIIVLDQWFRGGKWGIRSFLGWHKEEAERIFSKLTAVLGGGI